MSQRAVIDVMPSKTSRESIKVIGLNLEHTLVSDGLKRKWIVSLEGFSNPLFSIAAEWPLIVDWCSWNLTLPFPLRSCSLILCPCRVVVAFPCDTKHRELWTTTSANCWFIFFVSWKVNPQREFQLYIPTHRLRRKSVNWNSFLFCLWCGVGVA